jgi:hypothetical protein
MNGIADPAIAILHVKNAMITFCLHYHVRPSANLAAPMLADKSKKPPVSRFLFKSKERSNFPKSLDLTVNKL